MWPSSRAPQRSYRYNPNLRAQDGDSASQTGDSMCRSSQCFTYPHREPRIPAMKGPGRRGRLAWGRNWGRLQFAHSRRMVCPRSRRFRAPLIACSRSAFLGRSAIAVAPFALFVGTRLVLVFGRSAFAAVPFALLLLVCFRRWFFGR